MKASTSIAGPIGIVVLLSLVFAVSAVDAATVKIDPTSQTIAAGDPFHVDITIEDVLDLVADQAVLNFDPNAMQVTGVIEGDFLKTVGSTLGVGVWDNTEGTATFSYSFSNLLDKVSGSGTLATVEFDIYPDAPSGTYNLDLTGVILLNVSDAEISTDTSDGTVTILSTTTPTSTRTPRPNSGGRTVVVFDATGEDVADTHVADAIDSTPATTAPTTTTTPDTTTNVSMDATATTDTSPPTPSSVPGLSGRDMITASGMLAILFAVRKRKRK